MKTLKNLWNQFLSDENIKLAIYTVASSDSSKSKRKQRMAKKWDKEADLHIEAIRQYAMNFHNAYHKPKRIIEHGKERVIIAPTLMEEYVHHMLIQCMKPMLKDIYAHSYCSVPGRGSHAAIKRITRYAHYSNNDYCCQMDIRHFFESIPHDKLKARLDIKIKDRRFKQVLFEVINATESGLPIGFFTSQWLTNWYLVPLDKYITEVLKCNSYTRYNDDMIIIDSNKEKLHRAKDNIEIFLKDELGLTLKQNWQVYQIAYPDHWNEKKQKMIYKGRPINVIGFEVYKDKLLLRKRNMLKATRKAKKMAKKKKPTVYDCRQMINYLANFKMTDTYNCFQKYITPYVSVGQIKRRISKYDKNKRRKK